MGAAIRDGIVALTGILGPVCGNAGDFFVRRDLAEQIRQDRCLADGASGDLDGADRQRFLIDPKMTLAPDPPLGTAMLAGVPLAFALDLDPGAIDQHVQRTLFGPRDSVLELGSAQLRPASRSRFSTNPVVCRSARPNSPGLCPFRAEARHWRGSWTPFTLHRQACLVGAVV